MYPSLSPGAPNGNPVDAPTDLDLFGRWSELRKGLAHKLWGRVRVDIALLVVVALAAAITVWRAASADDPAQVVRSYLEAIQAHDITKALRIADVSKPGLKSDSFLTADAIGNGWRVGSVRKGYVHEEAGVRTTEVTVELVGRTVDKLGKGAEGTFSLTAGGGRWLIDDPFVNVEFGDSALWYAEVGDVRIPWDHYPVSSTYTSDPVRLTYPVFPGVYRLNKKISGFVTTDTEVFAALPGEHSTTVSVSGAETASSAMIAPVQRAADEFLDSCVGSQQNAAPGGCTLYPFSDYYRTEDDTVFVSSIVSAQWAVVRYPVVNVLVGQERALDSGLAGSKWSADFV